MLVVPVFRLDLVVDGLILDCYRDVGKVELFIRLERDFDNLLLFGSNVTELGFEPEFAFFNKWFLDVEFEIFL